MKAFSARLFLRIITAPFASPQFLSTKRTRSAVAHPPKGKPLHRCHEALRCGQCEKSEPKPSRCCNQVWVPAAKTSIDESPHCNRKRGSVASYPPSRWVKIRRWTRRNMLRLNGLLLFSENDAKSQAQSSFPGLFRRICFRLDLCCLLCRRRSTEDRVGRVRTRGRGGVLTERINFRRRS